MTAPLSSKNPNVPIIEDAKQGIQSFAMYYYQSLLEAGFDVASSKQQVASLLEKQYYFFCEQGNITPKNLGSVGQRLSKVLKMISEKAKNDAELRAVYNDLVSIQSQLKR